MKDAKRLEQYELRLVGLEEADGEIKAHDLQLVLQAFLKFSERATRLIALGESSGKGTPPKWLKEALNITVKGLNEGSTIVAVDAPYLFDVAREQFGQSEFWREPVADSDTALDLAGYAMQEILSKNSIGDRYDTAIIDAALEFKKVAKEVSVDYHFKSLRKKTSGFTLSPDDYQKIADKKSKLPEPKAFIVSGMLDVIKHTSGQFQIELLGGDKLLGKIHPEYLDQDHLKGFWGKAVTAEGMVSFKPNGKPRLIQARKLTHQQAGDEVFQKLPRSRENLSQKELFPEVTAQLDVKKSDPMSMWGLWEGEESIEELLTQLD